MPMIPNFNEFEFSYKPPKKPQVSEGEHFIRRFPIKEVK